MLKKYEKDIFLILAIFKSDGFKEERLNVYNTKPEMLNPLEMYVIEEIYRLGHNGYFNSLSKIESRDIVAEYNVFMKKFNDKTVTKADLEDLQAIYGEIIFSNDIFLVALSFFGIFISFPSIYIEI